MFANDMHRLALSFTEFDCSSFRCCPDFLDRNEPGGTLLIYSVQLGAGRSVTYNRWTSTKVRFAFTIFLNGRRRRTTSQKRCDDNKEKIRPQVIHYFIQPYWK